jgi:hypothetical protein
MKLDSVRDRCLKYCRWQVEGEVDIGLRLGEHGIGSLFVRMSDCLSVRAWSQPIGTPVQNGPEGYRDAN